jgi:hypothetical protein
MNVVVFAAWAEAGPAGTASTAAAMLVVPSHAEVCEMWYVGVLKAAETSSERT